MQLLKKRILQDGKCYEGGILKVDGFINHQMDPVLMKSIGVEFVRRFAATNVNKIMTIEASGIAPAIMTGYLMDDFLAYGNAALGILDLIEQSGAKLVGMGFIIEKAFQNGRKILEEKGVRVESLAIIEDLSNCCIKIKDQ